MQGARNGRAVAALLFATLVGTLVVKTAWSQESKLETLRAATKSQPNDADASLALGRALRRAGHERDAIAELRRGAFLALASPRSRDLAPRLHLETARAHLQLGEVGPAMVTCRALAAMPGGAASGLACTAEARLAWQLGGEALADASAALKLAPKSYEAKVAEGLAYDLELRAPEAERALREAISWRPEDALAHMHLGRILTERGAAPGKHDEGIAELRKAIELDPDWPEATYALATALPSTEEASSLRTLLTLLTLLTKVTRERPTFAPGWSKLADVSLALGKMDDARRAATVARKLAPNDPNALLVLGRVALEEGRAHDAIASALAADKLVAGAAKPKLLLADAYAKRGDLDLALEQYQAAWGLDHGDASPLLHAAAACHANARDASAKAFALRATQEFPRLGAAWEALGDAFVGQSDAAAAKGAYEKALAAETPGDAGALRKKLAALK